MKVQKKHLLGMLLLGAMGINIPIYAVAGQWSSSGSTIYYNDGNVGLGTSSPSNKLDVMGTITAGDTTSNVSGFKSRAPAGKWGFNQADIMVMGVGGNVYSKGFSNNAMGIFNGTTTFQDMFLYNKNGADAGYLVLKSNNRVGINTTLPLGILDIAGSGTISNLYASNIDTTNWLDLKNTSDGSRYMFNNAGSKLEIGVTDGTNGVTHWEVLKIIRNGDIIMGSNADTVNLSVNGAIKTKQVLVTNTGWADYVFADDYKLKPLSEVQSFIDQNKHLPNVPSAKEVEENGISVGDMQKTQMEKIEELTLYILKLDERINKLENENRELRLN